MPGPDRRRLMLLSLNTCGRVATIALGKVSPAADDVKILATADLAPRTTAAQLVPAISAMLESRGLTMRDVQAVVVVNGPGSFTGVRVGVSTAKGLTEGAQIPLIAVSRLALLAAASGLPHVLAAVDAGRGDYYVGEYRDGQKLSEALLSGKEAVAVASRPGAAVLLCDESNDGEAASPGAGACSALAICGPFYVQPPDAAEALRFALPRWRARAFDDPETLEVNYLRRTDAEKILAAKTGAAASQ